MCLVTRKIRYCSCCTRASYKHVRHRRATARKEKNHSKWLNEKVNTKENGKLLCQWCFIELTLNDFVVVFVYFFPLFTSFLSWRISLESNQRSHISDRREAGKKSGENAHIRCSATAMNLPNAHRCPAEVSFFPASKTGKVQVGRTEAIESETKYLLHFDCEY